MSDGTDGRLDRGSVGSSWSKRVSGAMEPLVPWLPKRGKYRDSLFGERIGKIGICVRSLNTGGTIAIPLLGK